VLSSTSNQIQALDWLFQNALTPAPGVRLAAVNMSLEGGQFTGTCDGTNLKASIDSLRTAGVVTVIAAGNDSYTAAIGSPACISTAVAVGSSDKADKISSFTNMSSQVALMAPGGRNDTVLCLPYIANTDILSSVSETTSAQTQTYDCKAGTSMAAPHVAGAFAAIRSVCPHVTIDRILAALQNTGVPIKDTRRDGT
jgi:subtilisin family serine protease